MKKMIIVLIMLEIFSMIFMPVFVTAMFGKTEQTSLILENTDEDNNGESAFDTDDEKDTSPASSENAAKINKNDITV